MQLFNTLSRTVEEFTPQDPHNLSLYTCGPTVYDFLHVGNWATNIRWDLLARTLRAQGWNVNWYMNITDVGHLVSDADDGQDKLEKGAARENKTAWEVADFYTADFMKGLDALGISIAHDHLPKATDHIAEQISLIKKLEAGGHTYATEDGVYFDSSTFADYGKLAKLDIRGLDAGARVAMGDKRSPTDFALWKFSPSDSKRDMEWDSPWGKGFPGWHIECSAMAMKYLGETLDIHAGGIDHIPIHHTNEIAQSEAATGKPFARFWVHSNFLMVNDQKIAKSGGNGITLSDITAKGYSPHDLRVLILQSHYRTQANFTWELLQAARQRRLRWQAFADLRWQLVDQETSFTDQFVQGTEALHHALSSDLDTPAAVVAIEQAISGTENGVGLSDEPALRKLLEAVRDLLGLDLLATPDITSQQRDSIAQRENARQTQNWALADKLRDQLAAENITVRDTDSYTFWTREI